MANPFASLGAVPIMQTIQDTLQRQANLQATQVGTAMESAKLNLMNQEMQRNQEYRDAVMRGRVLNPAINNPQTTSIASTEGSGASPMNNIVKSLNDERNSILEDIALTKLYPSKDALESQRAMYSHLSNIDTQLREATTDANKERIDNMEKSASVFRKVNSPESLGAAMNHLASVDPAQAFNLDRQLPKDPNTGAYLFNEPAKRAIGNYVDGNLKLKDALDFDDKNREYKRKLDVDEERIRHDKEEEKRQAAAVAATLAGIAARKEMHKETLAAAGIKYDGKLIDSTQKQIDKLATDAKLGDFKAASDIASRVESKLVDPAQGYASVTPEDARQLVEQAKRLQQNFRSFGAAGKMQESEIKNMNSFLEGYEKWVQSIGSGDPILAKDQMLNLAETMKNVYNDRNAEQVKQELQSTKILTERGGRPDWVRTRGNIDDLKENGRAFEVMINGKPHLGIVPAGKTKKDLTKNDFYEIPQAPKPPSFLPITE